MRGKIAAGVMTALLVLYLVIVGQRAVLLIAAGSVVGIVMGLALIVLPIIAAVFVYREILFGVRAERLLKQLGAAGQLADCDFARTPSGRIVREEADERFGAFRDEVEQNPTSYSSWFRLGLAYDACGDRKRARGALREAIRLNRQHPELAHS